MRSCRALAEGRPPAHPAMLVARQGSKVTRPEILACGLLARVLAAEGWSVAELPSYQLDSRIAELASFIEGLGPRAFDDLAGLAAMVGDPRLVLPALEPAGGDDAARWRDLQERGEGLVEESRSLRAAIRALRESNAALRRQIAAVPRAA